MHMLGRRPTLEEARERDVLRAPAGTVLAWVLPTATAMAISMARLPLRVAAFAWTGAFVWMGSACLFNALRCGRLHCYIAGPVLLAGAAACALAGVGVLGSLGTVIWATAALVLLSFLSEYLWGTYRVRRTPR